MTHDEHADTKGLDEPCFDSCEERAGTDLGSSRGYPAHSNYDSGYMATKKESNPLAYNGHTVYIKYCMFVLNDHDCHCSAFSPSSR